MAVKVVRSAFAGEDQIRRFRAERQILASLDHPHIARLYDGGATEEGLPYFVLEYIEGEPIDEYCDRQRLLVGERLELFRRVCSAVHHAHQNLVVHRDLKPDNILVTVAGVPKLLDFGIAKLLQPDLSDLRPEPTAAWLRLMTPDYASPEQVQGKPVTTASDVYSLGVLLYKLLTGRLPHRCAGQTPEQIERAIIEAEPEKPSAALVDGPHGAPAPEAETNEAVARARGTHPAQLRRLLAGDLGNVVLKALRKEPQRRYASVEQFAEDLRRHLEGLPVLAHPDSLPYRGRKFLRRNRLAAAGAVVALLAAVGAAVVLVLQSARVARERDRAERERNKAQVVAEFLEEVFTLSHRADPRIEPMTAREVLDRGSRKLEAIQDQPHLQASLMHTMGRIYRDLGNYEQAQPLLERALAARRQEHGADPAEVVETMEDLGVLLFHKGEYNRAEALLNETLRLARDSLGEKHRLVPWTLAGLAVVRQVRGDYEVAEQQFRESLRLFAGSRDLDPLEVAATQGNLAVLLFARGSYDEAEAMQRTALATYRRILGAEDLTTALATNNLALILGAKGDYRGAIAGATEFLALQRRLLHDEHPDVAGALSNLAVLYCLENRHEQAERAARQGLALRQTLFGDRHPLVAESLLILGRSLHGQGKLAEAEPPMTKGLTLLRDLLGPEHPSVARAMVSRAKLLAAKGDAAAAEPLLRDALAQQTKLLGAEHPEVAATLVALGQFLTATGRAAEGEPLLRQALEVRRRRLPPSHPGIAEAEAALARSRERPALARRGGP